MWKCPILLHPALVPYNVLLLGVKNHLLIIAKSPTLLLQKWCFFIFKFEFSLSLCIPTTICLLFGPRNDGVLLWCLWQEKVTYILGPNLNIESLLRYFLCYPIKHPPSNSTLGALFSNLLTHKAIKANENINMSFQYIVSFHEGSGCRVSSGI